jgi:bifunctional non-homologous end joining protein LigD
MMATPLAGEHETIEIDGRAIRLTHPDRILWPETGTTKRDLVAYYLRIAPALLPHVRGRALTLGRWPEGVDRTGWLQADCRGRPEWLPVVETVTKRRGGRFAYCMVEDRAGLAWLANLGTIELHPFLALASNPADAAALVVDLDPGPPAGLLDCARLALEIRGHLQADGLNPFVKVSGMLGLHVIAALAPGESFAATKAYARGLARRLAAADPARVTDVMARDKRAGRVFIDWVQNDASRSTVAAYSPRAARWPTVSMPVTWDELAVAVTATDAKSLVFTMVDAVERVEARGDLLAPLLTSGEHLPYRAPAG